MTTSSMTFQEYLRQVGGKLDGDFLKQAAQLMSQMTLQLVCMPTMIKYTGTPAGN